MSTAATTPGEAPQPIVPSPQPSLPASMFKNEGRDTSAEALEKNELGVKNDIKPEPPPVYRTAPPEPAAVPQVEVTQAASSTPTESVVPTGMTREQYEALLDAPAPELINGKYKTLREQVKAYQESQKGFGQKVQSEVERQLSEKVQAGVQAKLKELTDTQKAAVQAQGFKSLTEMSADEHLDLFTKDPVEYNRLQQAEMFNAIKTSQAVEQWSRENADIKDELIPGSNITGEQLVNLQLLTLAKRDPSRASDYPQLLSEATGHVRNLIEGLKNQGKQAAQIIRETVTPLQATVASTTAPAETAQAPAKKNVDPVEEEVERLRAEKRRISGGKEQVRW